MNLSIFDSFITQFYRYTIEPDSSFQKEPESKDNRKIEILEKNEKEQLQCTELDLMESSFQDSEILDNFELLTPSLVFFYFFFTFFFFFSQTKIK